MNKKEFKELYAAARLIKNAAYSRGIHNNTAIHKAWDMSCDIIDAMPSAVSCAVWGWLSVNTSTIYAAKQNKWALNHNSRAFGAVKCRSRGTL